MTPLLLTLASLTPGDGGPGGRAAREPVEAAVKLAEGFKGFLQLPGGPLCPVELMRGGLHIAGPRGVSTLLGCSLRREGCQRFRLSWGDDFTGTIRRDGARLVLTLDWPAGGRGSWSWRRLVEKLAAGPPKP
jgi:hypothetical protein